MYIYNFNVFYNNTLVASETNSISNSFTFIPIENGNYKIEATVTDYLNNIITCNETIAIKYIFKICSNGTLQLSSKVPKDFEIARWSSDDPNIAEVDKNGIVVGKLIGETTIMAISTSGELLCWKVEVTYNWWQIILMLLGIGVFMLPTWVAY